MYGDSLKVQLDDLYRVNKPSLSDDYILQNGDILIVRSSVKREGVAWATLFDEINEPVTFCGFIIRCRPREIVNPEFMVYFLRSQPTREELISRAKQSTITNINQQNLGQLIVPVPNEAIQNQVVANLHAFKDETQRLEAIYQQKLAALAELKQSILHQAFNGEL